MKILVGIKPVKSYLVYALTSLATDNNILIMARGRSISKAVDLAEILKRQTKGLEQKSIVIGTETVHDKKTDRDVRVSTIEISLNRQDSTKEQSTKK